MPKDPDEPEGLKKDTSTEAKLGAEFCEETVDEDTSVGVEFEEDDDD